MSRARDLANRTIASAALPKAGGAMTGAITTNSTFDGIDVATRDALHAPLASPDFTGTVDLTGTTVSLDDDEISLDKVNGGTLGTGTIGGSAIVNTSGAITTTGAFTSIGIDDNSTETAMTIDSNEIVTVPKNPSFSLKYVLPDCTGNATSWPGNDGSGQSATAAKMVTGYLNASAVNTEYWDANDNMAGVCFTAPVDGMYAFFGHMNISDVDDQHAYGFWGVSIAGIGITAWHSVDWYQSMGGATSYYNIGFGAAHKMDALDTAFPYFAVYSGDKEVNIDYLYYSGFLVS
jgi:hypothetical protein